MNDFAALSQPHPVWGLFPARLQIAGFGSYSAASCAKEIGSPSTRTSPAALSTVT
jgi:hypothetical protein